MADRLLVLGPHEHTHAPRSILEQARKLGPDLTEMRAIQHTMELIAHSFCIANGATGKGGAGGLAWKISDSEEEQCSCAHLLAEWNPAFEYTVSPVINPYDSVAKC